MYFDWIRKGKPLGTGVQTQKFQKNCVILLDRLIFEYINLQWRGSGDSKIARNVDNVRSSSCPDVFVPVSKDDWADTLNIMRNKLAIGDNNEISYSLMKPLLYHSYCLMNISGRDSQYTIEDEWLKNQIVSYEYIPLNKFEDFSNVNNYEEMFDLGKTKFFDIAFGTKRYYLLND